MCGISYQILRHSNTHTVHTTHAAHTHLHSRCHAWLFATFASSSRGNLVACVVLTALCCAVCCAAGGFRHQRVDSNYTDCDSEHCGTLLRTLEAMSNELPAAICCRSGKRAGALASIYQVSNTHAHAHTHTPTRAPTHPHARGRALTSFCVETTAVHQSTHNRVARVRAC